MKISDVDFDDFLKTLDGFDRDTVEYLRSDKTWKWIMDKKEFKKLVKEYKKKTKKNLSWLAEEVMEIPVSDPLNHFSKYRANEEGRHVSALAIYRLAAELNAECEMELEPKKFAEPKSTKEKEKDSLNRMDYLWELPSFKEELKKFAKKTVAAFPQYGRFRKYYTVRRIVKIFLDDLRKLIRIILFPYLWLRSKPTYAKVLAGGVLVATLIIVGVKMLTPESGHNRRANHDEESTAVSPDKHDKSDSPEEEPDGKSADIFKKAEKASLVNNDKAEKPNAETAKDVDIPLTELGNTATGAFYTADYTSPAPETTPMGELVLFITQPHTEEELKIFVEAANPKKRKPIPFRLNHNDNSVHMNLPLGKAHRFVIESSTLGYLHCEVKLNFARAGFRLTPSHFEARSLALVSFSEELLQEMPEGTTPIQMF